MSDPHSLAAKLLYENGLPIVAMVLAVGFVSVRVRRRAESADAPLGRASSLGLLGFAVTSLAGRPFAAPALPFAAVLLLGTLQASEMPRAPAGRRPHWVVLAALLALVLAPLDYAHVTYDRASAAPSGESRAELLERAVAFDPAFPLYRARLALLRRDLGQDGAETDALAAAEAATGLAPLFLLAGVLAKEPATASAKDALLRACALDPLGGLAPFHLATLVRGDLRAPEWAARSIMAEPYLAAAEALRRRPLMAAALAVIRGLESVDPAWTERLVRSLERAPASPGTRRRLVLEMDAEGSTSLSLHAFRRSPWPARIDEVRIVAEDVPEVESLARSRASDVRLFRSGGCALPSPP